MAKGDVLSIEEINELYGVSIDQSFPRDASGAVSLVAVKPDLNPEAPEIIYCSEAVRPAVETLLNSKIPVPVFVQVSTNQWQDRGQFVVDDLNSNEVAVRAAITRTKRDQGHDQGPIWALLYLRAVGS